MGTFILAAIIIFFGSAFVAAVINKIKEKKFEKGFFQEVVKTKKTYKGSLTRYTDKTGSKTYLRYFISGKMNTLTDFITTDEIIVNNYLVLFDEQHKKLAIIKDFTNHGVITTMNFSDLISLEPVEISTTKKVTRGGISPIAICGYRWASVTTKMLKEVERIYIEIKYNAHEKKQSYELTVFDGFVKEDVSEYKKIVTRVNETINKFHDVIAKSQ